MSLKNNLWSKGKFFLLISILFYIILGIYSESSDFLSAFTKINIGLYLLSFLMFIPMFFIQALRYHFILRKLEIETSLRNSVLIHFSSLSMLITPGASGSLLKSVLLKKKSGHSISSTSPIVFFERWLELTSITIIIGILFFWYSFLESLIVFAIASILTVLFFFILKNSSGINFINKLLIKSKILKNYVIDETAFSQTSKILTTAKNTLSFLLLSLSSKIFPIISIFTIFELFGISFDIFHTSQIYFVGQIIGALSFIPGGILITEASLLGLMMNAGIDLTISSVLVILIRILTFWFPIILGFVVLRTIVKKL